MKKMILLHLVLAFLVACLAPKITTANGAEENRGFSIAETSELLEDPSGELTIYDVLKDSVGFEIIGVSNKNLDFTSSSYWVKFKLKSELNKKQQFILEVARTLTNVADLYKIENGEVKEKVKHGDELPFFDRKIKHRKILHELTLEPKENALYYINFKSDGEVLTLPMKLWKYKAFMDSDYKEQFILGFYYGILGFVVIIYFFFYKALRDKSFLYYVIYVLSLICFQLAIDGLAFQYFWPGNVWLGNHSVLIFAAFTVFMVNLYAKTYLKTSEFLPLSDKIFNYFLAVSLVSVALGCAKGPLYAASFPIVNGLALISTLFIVVSIVLSFRKNLGVSLYFALAFIFLIAGTFLFILTNFSLIPKNMFTEHAIKFGSAFEVIFLSITMAGKYQDAQKEKEDAQAEAMEKLEEINKIREEVNVKLEKQVKERTKEIEEKKEEIEEINNDIMDSIHYSQRIQNAILPSKDLIKECLAESFVLFNPKDVVSGDFYWVAPVTTTNTNEKVILFCVADCTGHGVPGAFMSLIGNSYLKLSLSEPEVNSPAQALDFLNKGVNSTLQQNNTETLRDGMDIALCAWFPDKKKLFFSGAKNPLYVVRKGELIEIKGDKHPVGAHLGEELEPFTNHEIELEGGECLYLFSDGFPDQFGGPKGKKFMYGRFKKLLVEIHKKSMSEQAEILRTIFTNWKGDLEQIDDVCIIGVRV